MVLRELYMLLVLGLGLCGLVSGATVAEADLVACFTPAGQTPLLACGRELPLTPTDPLGGTHPLEVQECTDPGFTCVPVQKPIGDWIGDDVQVFNQGQKDAGAFTIGLYVSRRVDPVTRACALDMIYPLRDAIQIAEMSMDGLRQGEFATVSFPRLPQIESWMASQWNADRNAMHRCMFLWVDDEQTVPELQATEENNLLTRPVKLLDLVDLTPTGFQVDFDSTPWMAGRVRNDGMQTAPTFSVDFYQVDVNANERCPTLTNKEYPLTLPRDSENYATYLGSTTVANLQPGQERLVFPQVSRLPGTVTERDSTCLLMFVDSGLNVPEPYDGRFNILSSAPTVTITEIQTFIQPPEVIVITKPWNKMIIVYAIAGFLFLVLLCYLYYRWRKRLELMHLNETQYLDRMKLREKPPEEKKEEPIPFFHPDDDFLQEEEANKEANPDYDRPIRIGARARKTGVVRDKRGNIIGTIAANGVIRDKTGKRIGVSSYGASPADPKASRTVLDGYFGGTT